MDDAHQRWDKLVETLAVHGVEATVEALDQLEVSIEFTDAARSRLLHA